MPSFGYLQDLAGGKSTVPPIMVASDGIGIDGRSSSLIEEDNGDVLISYDSIPTTAATELMEPHLLLRRQDRGR